MTNQLRAFELNFDPTENVSEMMFINRNVPTWNDIDEDDTDSDDVFRIGVRNGVYTCLIGKDPVYAEIPEEAEQRGDVVLLLVPSCTCFVPIGDFRKEGAE
jgi:hypothetical protein